MNLIVEALLVCMGHTGRVPHQKMCKGNERKGFPHYCGRPFYVYTIYHREKRRAESKERG